MGTMAAAGAHAAARPAGFPRATAKVFGRFGLSRRRAAPILRAPRAVAGGVSRHPRRAGESSPRDAPDARLESLLSKVRAALGVSGAADAHDSAMIWGEGENLGMPTRWCLRHDGARFLEEAIGPELSYVSGCDYESFTVDESFEKHTNTNTVWETDFSGYTQVLALDDREAALLLGWTRSHFWCKPEARKWLRLEILYDDAFSDSDDDSDSDSDETIMIGARLNDGVLNATIFIDAKTYLPKRMTARVCGDTEKWTFDEWAPLEDFVSPKSGEDSNPPSYDSSGKSSSKKSVASGAMYPGLTVLEGSAGGKQTFRVTRARCNSGATNPDAFYRAPIEGTEPSTSPTSTKKSAKKLAGGVSFAPGVAPEVVIERARSSHVLVRPLIDGVDVGPFILDTGASGLVITKAAAARVADCASFGEVFVSGVSGKVPCRFRRASNMTLGPIVIDSPVFMEMALGGIVSGSVEPVAGIVGFDAFKSAIVEVGPGGAPVRIYDPRTFKPDANWAWHAIALVSNVPHAFATFSTVHDEDDDEDETYASSSSEADFDDAVNRGKKKSSAVFMIDSGAGGADAIFHKRAVEALGLRRLMPPPAGGGARGASRVRGVGGSDGESSGATRAYRGELRWLELDKVSAPTRLDDETALSDDANAKPKPSKSTSKKSKSREKETAKSERPVKGSGGRFENLNVLLAADAGFDLSEHSVGLICANVLNTRRVVYDVPNRRVAFLVDGADKSPCESLLCGVFDWESDEGDEVGDSESNATASSRSETTGRADLRVTLPTPTTEELELFGDSVRFGQNE